MTALELIQKIRKIFDEHYLDDYALKRMFALFREVEEKKMKKEKEIDIRDIRVGDLLRTDGLEYAMVLNVEEADSRDLLGIKIKYNGIICLGTLRKRDRVTVVREDV